VDSMCVSDCRKPAWSKYHHHAYGWRKSFMALSLEVWLTNSEEESHWNLRRLCLYSVYERHMCICATYNWSVKLFWCLFVFMCVHSQLQLVNWEFPKLYHVTTADSICEPNTYNMKYSEISENQWNINSLK